MSRWRPSPDEERWLEVMSDLGSAVSKGALAERSGGWRSSGTIARTALFVLGFIAAALLVGILGFSSEITLLIAGLVAVFAAESLIVAKRMHASGIEEGLCVAGYLLIGFWVTTLDTAQPDFAGASFDTLVLIVAAGAAGLRLLNPLVTTCAAIALVYWVGSTTAAHALDQTIGAGVTAVAFGGALAALALALGARQYRRPSHDRMLDWLVATLPLAAYWQRGAWSAYEMVHLPVGSGSGRVLTVALLLALGAAMLVMGLRRRRHAPLLGFMGCVAGLAVESRLSTPLAAETWHIVCGLVALVAGVALDRYLRQPRNGLTSAPLTKRDGPLDVLQTAGAAVLAGRDASGSVAPEPEVKPGEGRFGGGGATGSY